MRETRSFNAADRNRSAKTVPGLWAGLGICLVSGAVFATWFEFRNDWPEVTASVEASQITEVPDAELPAAMETLNAPKEQLARFGERDACTRKLAFVVIALSPGQQPGRIRIQSGNYLSPIFTIAPAPTRVAIPFPAAYASGRGTVSVLGTTGASVALTPPWATGPQRGAQTHAVTWIPAPPCAGPKP